MNVKALEAFVGYCNRYIKGDEKGEAQTFLDRFFVSLGYKDGYKEAGAMLEQRVKGKDSVGFADLFWPKRVLIEMKKSEEDLGKHLQQVQTYWLKLAGTRPRYVILCNFLEFWIYDFEKDIYEPADKIPLDQLSKRGQSFSFLLPIPASPVFRNNREAVTKGAAYMLAAIFSSLLKRGIERDVAVHYLMQCILSMFAQNVNLLPDSIFTRIITECLDHKRDDHLGLSPDSYDLVGALFREMNTKGITAGGKFKNVDFFNGGLFQDINPIELNFREIELLENASKKDWSQVNPAIFGSFFEAGMDKGERHVSGVHYTYEIDIKKIVDPVIVQPWKKKIEQASSSENPLDEYYKLLTDLRTFSVLDPACGSGNFLFVAYREMKMLEKELLALIRENSITRESGKQLTQFLSTNNYVSTKQFFGIDKKPFAVELAKMTLMVAKELWVAQSGEAFDNEAPLPLENLEDNIRCMDALVNEDGTPTVWPEVDAIIGNPPFQSKNKMRNEFGMEYLNKIRSVYPEVPGRADFCVYWFHKAHIHLKPYCSAGLVGTHTITQNYSREGSLDFIVKNGGTIYNAVASQDWSGEAAVHVSIACWKKGEFKGQKYLYVTSPNDEWEIHKVIQINSSLSLSIDVSIAKVIASNRKPKQVFQGQTHGHEGFLLDKDTGLKLLKEYPEYSSVVKPFLIGDELVADQNSQPKRFVIDFTGMDVMKASSYKKPFDHVQMLVMPDRKKKAEDQETENKVLFEKNPDAKVNKHHITFYNKWWQLSYGRLDMLSEINQLGRYISVPQVSLRPTFEFISSAIRPNAALMVFAFEDYYSFGIIQSNLHWEWWKKKCSTLGTGFRYTTNTVWDTFPWPQDPTEQHIKEVAGAAKALHHERTKALRTYDLTLRELYRTLERPGKSPIKDLHSILDKAVMKAYGFDPTDEVLAQLLELNLSVSEREAKDKRVQAPGLPNFYPVPNELITDDCVKFEM